MNSRTRTSTTASLREDFAVQEWRKEKAKKQEGKEKKKEKQEEETRKKTKAKGKEEEDDDEAKIKKKGLLYNYPAAAPAAAAAEEKDAAAAEETSSSEDDECDFYPFFDEGEYSKLCRLVKLGPNSASCSGKKEKKLFSALEKWLEDYKPKKRKSRPRSRLLFDIYFT